MSSMGDSSWSAAASSTSDPPDHGVAGAGTDGTDMYNHYNNVEPTDNEVDDELKELLDSKSHTALSFSFNTLTIITCVSDFLGKGREMIIYKPGSVVRF